MILTKNRGKLLDGLCKAISIWRNILKILKRKVLVITRLRVQHDQYFLVQEFLSFSKLIHELLDKESNR